MRTGLLSCLARVFLDSRAILLSSVLVACPTIAGQVGIEIIEPVERVAPLAGVPVDVGVTFPQGKLLQSADGKLPRLQLIDDNDKPIPFTANPTGWWEPPQSVKPRSVRWLMLHFKADTNRNYVLLVDEESSNASSHHRLKVSDRGGRIEIRTGAMTATLDRSAPGSLFGNVRIHGRRILAGHDSSELVLVAYDANEQREFFTTIQDWNLEIEEVTELKAIIKASGVYVDEVDRPIARVELRYQFFSNESFVRVHHTLVWLRPEIETGARQIAIRLRPRIKSEPEFRLGLSDYTNEAITLPASRGSHIYALQSSASHFTVSSGGSEVHAGDRLGGWVELRNDTGAGVGVTLKDTWQQFPKAFSFNSGDVWIELWASQGVDPMSFSEEAIMPPDYFCSSYWSGVPTIAMTGEVCQAICGHLGPCHGHEGSTVKFLGAPTFMHTGEGVAKTHELTIFFFDRRSGRTSDELNTITQHPVALRQDPASATNAPIFGIKLAIKDAARFPDVEHAIDTAARMALARWEIQHDYGYFRFGSYHWGGPGEASLYRWIDGLQYDNQVIPWILWLRGGGREYYEEGIRTALHAMDIETNHHSTRPLLDCRTLPCIEYGYWPSGFNNAASSMPFPQLPYMLRKETKIQYLALVYHLTGYQRAQEVMQLTINGATTQAMTPLLNEPGVLVHTQPSDRHRNNMNIFWNVAYQETWDPLLLDLSSEWFDRHLAAFGDDNLWDYPDFYLYNGNLMLQEVYEELGLDRVRAQQLTEQMLANLSAVGFPDLADGGIARTAYTIAAGWADDETNDSRYSQIAWDVARSLADTVPEFDQNSDVLPLQSMYLGYNSIYRNHILPMLVGVSQAYKYDYANDRPPQFKDVYFRVITDIDGIGRARAFVRPTISGDQLVKVIVRDTLGCAVPTFNVSAYGPSGEAVVGASGQPVELEIGSPDTQGEITIPNAQAGAIYRLEMFATPADCRFIHVNTRAENADLVHETQLECSAADSLRCPNFFHNAGQYYTGTRFVVKVEDMVNPIVTINNLHRHPYTIRNAQTWDVLFRSETLDPAILTHRLRPEEAAPDGLLAITVKGYNTPMGFDGIRPYFSATQEAWFDPLQ